MEVSETASDAFPITFRNYLPYDAGLQRYSILFKDISIQESKEEEGAVDNAGGRRKPPEAKKSAILQELEILSSDEIHIVPKKANSDLKKQVEERLKKLSKRTERALVDILREKLSREARMPDE